MVNVQVKIFIVLNSFMDKQYIRIKNDNKFEIDLRYRLFDYIFIDDEKWERPDGRLFFIRKT